MLQALKYDPGRNYSILCFCHNLIRFVVVSKMENTLLRFFHKNGYGTFSGVQVTRYPGL